MSIRPVEFNGMLQNQQGVSNYKQNEDARPELQQHQALNTVQHQEQRHASQVERKADADAQEYKFDAREEGKNKYQGSAKDKKRQPQKKLQDGSVRVKGMSGGFDITV